MSEILNRLKNRPRAVVSERDTSILTPSDSSKDITATQPSVVDEVYPSTGTTPTKSKSRKSHPQKLAAELAALTEVADRRQIRLEVSIDQELDALCKQQPKGQKMTVETFLEAAYLACKRDPELMQQIMNEAAERLVERKRAGKLRRLQSQLEAVTD